MRASLKRSTGPGLLKLLKRLLLCNSNRSRRSRKCHSSSYTHYLGQVDFNMPATLSAEAARIVRLIDRGEPSLISFCLLAIGKGIITLPQTTLMIMLPPPLERVHTRTPKQHHGHHRRHRGGGPIAAEFLYKYHDLGRKV